MTNEDTNETTEAPQDPLAALSDPAQLDTLIAAAERAGDVNLSIALKRQAMMRADGQTARADAAAQFINLTRLAKLRPPA